MIKKQAIARFEAVLWAKFFKLIRESTLPNEALREQLNGMVREAEKSLSEHHYTLKNMQAIDRLQERVQLQQVYDSMCEVISRAKTGALQEIERRESLTR